MSNKPMTVEQNTQLTTLATRIAVLEYRLESYKKLQEEEKNLKAALYRAMQENGIKKWEMPDGTKITLVDETPETEREVEVFDERLFKQEKPDIYYLYTRKEIKREKGRKGYVRVTLRKAKEKDGGD